jgi:hypothetical protein
VGSWWSFAVRVALEKLFDISFATETVLLLCEAIAVQGAKNVR